MEVDGLNAKSHVRAVYDRSQSEDINVPQLTMLQFRNPDGLVTDRFDSSDEGVLTFSAADFEHIFDPYYDDNGNVIGILEWYKFTSTPSVKVEYSPLDTDDWHELEVTEDPSKFIATGYGSYFSGSLAPVTEKAMHGWFDLKITLSDEGGNSLETFVSPAFKIKDLTGVSNLTDDADKEVKEIYNMQGLRVSSPRSGEVVIERMNDGTTRKRIAR